MHILDFKQQLEISITLELDINILCYNSNFYMWDVILGTEITLSSAVRIHWRNGSIPKRPILPCMLLAICCQLVCDCLFNTPAGH